MPWLASYCYNFAVPSQLVKIDVEWLKDNFYICAKRCWMRYNGQNGRTRWEEGWKVCCQKCSKPTVFMVTILNRWLSKPIILTLRTNYDSNPLPGIIEMHWVESVPQSCLNNENLFLRNVIVFLSLLNGQGSLTLSFFSLLGWMEEKGENFLLEFWKKDVIWFKRKLNINMWGFLFLQIEEGFANELL